MVTKPDTYVEAAVKTGLIDRRTAGVLRRETGLHDRRETLEAIVRHCRTPAGKVYQSLAEVFGMEYLDAASLIPHEGLLKRMPGAIIRRRRVLPVRETEKYILLATGDPGDLQTFDTVRRLLGKPVKPALSDPNDLEAAIQKYFSGRANQSEANPAADSEEFDAIAFLNKLMNEAFLRGASDIHLEPQDDGMRIRTRVDGRLHRFQRPVTAEHGMYLVSRVKVLAGLDISERRASQDGGFSYLLPSGERIDIRVATAPTHFGERATMRLLGLGNEGLTLDNIGFSFPTLEAFRKIIRKPHGIVLLAGPTGSGKTTTLYAALQEINSEDKNIITIEDPVEYALQGVSQLQVDSVGKITFAKAIRSLLRHDPDVMMVGEIRDYETADAAMKAAMTGHLVFSTLHTNTACAAVTRLVDLGCEPYLVGATLNAVISQRLVRRLCPHCKKTREISEQEANALGIEPGTRVSDATGCRQCMNTGYKGRIAIFESLWVDGELTHAISRGTTEEQALRHIARHKITPLIQDGAAKIACGITSVEEVFTVTGMEY